MLDYWNLPSLAAGKFRPTYKETQASLLDEERVLGAGPPTKDPDEQASPANTMKNKCVLSQLSPTKL